jgi:prepilin-type N-terminal cleavage/methylation domain-containing protein
MHSLALRRNPCGLSEADVCSMHINGQAHLATYGGVPARRVGDFRLLANRNKLNPHGGFTLVELLVTVVVILTLTAVAVPIYIGQTGKSKDASLFSDANNVARVIAESVSKGEFNPSTGLIDTAEVTIATNRVAYAGQSVTSKGAISIFPGVGAELATTVNLNKINPANGSFCVQVSTETNSAYYFTRGTRGAGTCAGASQ